MNIEDMSNEELADALETMRITGVCPSRTEKEMLHEAAERLRKTQNQQDSKIASEVRIINLAKEMEIKIITKGEPDNDRSRTKETLLSDKP